MAAHTAYAQETPAPEAQAVQIAIADAGASDADFAIRDEIIVRGEKIERTLQDTVTSVAVFTNEIIEEQNFINFNDVLQQTANVSTIFDTAGFTIRGQRNSGAAPGDQSSDVSAVYLDGVFVPSSLFGRGAFNLWDVESIEVFRGPQSTIQGRNALAGAIVAHTVDPGSEFEGAAQFSYADYNTLRGSAALSLPVVKDQIALRISGDYSGSDGFNFNPTLNSDEIDRFESVNARARLLLTPEAIPDLTARLTFTYIDNEQGRNRIIESRFPEERITEENIEGRDFSEAFVASAEFEYDITENLRVTSVSAFIDNETSFVFDGTVDSFGSDIPNVTMSDDRIFSQEVRFNYTGDRFDALLGGYFFDSEDSLTSDNSVIADTAGNLPSAPILAGLLFMTPQPTPLQIGQADALRSAVIGFVPSFEVLFERTQAQEIRNYAVFGETSFRATDKLTLTFGARYDIENVDQDIFDSQAIPPFPATPSAEVNALLSILAAQFTSIAEITADNDFTAFLPKGVITYDWTDNLSTSVSVQRAYRAGGVSVNLFQAALARQAGTDQTDQEVLEAAGIVNAFDPEFTMNYEFALRSQWFDDRLTVNANAFFIDYNDQQVTLQFSPNALDTLTDNVGESRLFGFELETFASPVDGLDLYANVGFTDTEFTDGGNLVGDFDLTGLEFSLAPTWTAGAGARYTHSTGLFGNVRFRYTGDSFSIASNDETGINDQFTTVDINAGFEADNYKIELFVTNLFDDEYLTFNSIDNPTNPASLDDAVSTAGPPRVIGGRIVASF